MYRSFVDQDAAGAIAVVEEARASGMERESLFDELFVPAMALLGKAWAEAEIDEVTFTQAAVVAEQMTSFVAPHAAITDTGIAVVVGCAQGETHGVRRSMVGAALKEAGYRVIDLGVDVRAAEFLEKVEETGARIVIVCAETVRAVSAVESVRAMLDAGGHGDVVLLASGGPFEADLALARDTGANGVVRGAESALKVVARVVGDVLHREGSA